MTTSLFEDDLVTFSGDMISPVLRLGASTTLPRGSSEDPAEQVQKMPKLTKRTVEALRVRATDYIAFHAELPGFGVRVMPSGKRFFLVQYRRHGRTRRVMLGQFGPLTAEVARGRAFILLAQTHSGGSDPAAERDALRQSLTVEQLGARFLKEHVAVRCKPTTQSEYRRSVELFIDRFFGKQRILSVTTADVAELHGSLSHIPYQANRTLGVLSKMMNLAEIWGCAIDIPIHARKFSVTRSASASASFLWRR